MKKRILLSLVFGLLFATFTTNGAAEAAKVLRFAMFFPPDYYITKGFYRMAETVKKETNGEIEIKVFPAGQLGSYEQTFQEVMRGTIDMAGNYPTARFNKKFEVGSFPGLTKDFKEFKRLIAKDSPYTKVMKEAYTECGVVYIGSFPEAMMGCAVAKGKDIPDPFVAQSKGRVARVEPIAAKREWYVQMGFQVATVPFAEVFSSLQTGIIDCNTGAGPETSYLTLRDTLGSFVQYNNVVATNDFVVSKKAWDSLDQKTRGIIEKAFEAEVDKVFKDVVDSHNKYIAAMKKDGIKVIDPTEAQKDFMAKLAYEKIWPKYYSLVDKKVFDDIVAFVQK